jgi:EmrB/QacA subfamily drug resistance transporter
MRFGRRGLASIYAEIRDGILPAANRISRVPQTPAIAATPRSYRVTALIIACALFMEQMDATVLATALPTMARDFGVPATSMSSALTSYLLALAIFIPASGVLADKFGSRAIFRAAILIFVGGSLLCGQATSLPFMMIARFVQGLGGAMMIPIGRLVLLRSVAKEDMVSAMSWLIMPALIGPILGPPVGGLIVTYLDWRWIFWLNLPVGLLGVVLVTRYIGEVRGERPVKFDFTGFVLSGVSLGCLLFGFEISSRSGEFIRSLVLIAIGLGAGAAYLAHARRRSDPILDVSLLRYTSFRLSLIGGSLTRITQGAQPFLLPMMLQLGFGMTAAASGAITVAGAIGSLAMKGLAPRILRRFGFRRSLIVGGLGASVGYAICGAFRPDWPIPLIFAVLMSAGFFMSFQFSAYNTIAYDEVPKARMSAATSFYATFQQLMLSLGICVGAAGLHVGMLGTGRTRPELADFSLAFLLVTLVSASATIWNMRFAADAGAEMSGHRVKRG